MNRPASPGGFFVWINLLTLNQLANSSLFLYIKNMSGKIIKNWISLAEYDFESARVLFEGKRFLTMAFSCQQTIEKILKAIFVKEKNETPPYTHNLKKLLSLLSFYNNIDNEKIKIIEDLNSYYLETRYTEEIDELNLLLTENKAKELIEKTGGLYKWLKDKI